MSEHRSNPRRCGHCLGKEDSKNMPGGCLNRLLQCLKKRTGEKMQVVIGNAGGLESPQIYALESSKAMGGVWVNEQLFPAESGLRK